MPSSEQQRLLPPKPGTPSVEERRLDLRQPPPVRKGLSACLDSIQGRFLRRRSVIKNLGSQADQVLQKAASLEDLEHDEFQKGLADLQLRFRRHRRRDPALDCEALAFLCIVSRRRLAKPPYREQIMGALALRCGAMAEMATGEGKTLTVALAAVLAAWSGRSVHIVTANDYLARRDAETHQPFYKGCGLRAGFVTGDVPPADRGLSHAADVVYTTSRELMGDYLRDRLGLRGLHHGGRRILAGLRHRRVIGAGQIALRGLHTVYIDEADHVLVDEAVTPLIISQPRRSETFESLCAEAIEHARKLIIGSHFTVSQRFNEVTLREGAFEGWNPRTPLLRSSRWRREWLSQAIRALYLLERDKHYFVRDDKIVLIDEGTGRATPDRSLRQGLHQMLEAKEGLTFTPPAQTLASMSFQRFFRQIPVLAGVTGTARENASEFWSLYRMPVLVIPTHRPVQRTLYPERIFLHSEQRWDAVVRAIIKEHEKGRPILVGTRTVAASQLLASRLHELGMHYKLLNAAQNRGEADIIAEAGSMYRITIATNMAGRGTDIVPREGVVRLGGLHVIATERHRVRRVDRQLYGRSARQGDPGSVQQFSSLEDDLPRQYLPKWTQALLRHSHALPLWAPLARLALRWAQSRAESQALRQRMAVLRHDKWLDESLSLKQE